MRRSHGTTHMAPCSMQPPWRRGVRLEDAVEHERGEELLGLLVDDHVVLGPDVLAPAEEVRDRPAVVVERGLSVRPPPPMWLRKGTPRSSSTDHTGSWSGWVGDTPRPGCEGNRTAPAPCRAPRSRSPGSTRDRSRTPGRPGRGGVIGAEVDHRPVVRPERRRAPLGVLARELGRRERREHQLAVEAEQVQRTAPDRLIMS